MTGRRRNAKSDMPKAEFAALFGISESQLERLFQKGMPHAKDGRAVTIPMPAGRVWYHEYLVAKGKKLAAPTSIDEAVRRREAARAELEELKLARERAKTMLVDDGERLLAAAYGRVRAKLLNLAPRAAGAAFGASTLQSCQAKIEPLVHEIMEDLAAGADIPALDEPELEEDVA